MTARQARRERRAAGRKAKKLELKKSRRAEHQASADDERDIAVPPRWNPELEDEFPREVQIRNNARLDRLALKAGLPLPPPGPAAPAASVESLREHYLARWNASQAERETPAPETTITPINPPPETKRAETNRANAQHSTGPRTPQGKSSSSRNSLKHGLASGQVIIPGEDRAAFEALLTDLMEEHQPATASEEILVQQMAECHWLTQRAIRLQNDCFTGAGVNEKQLALFLRYQTTHERSFYKALNTLLKLKKQHRNDTIGFVSQKRTATPAENGFVSHASPKPPSQPAFVPQNATETAPGATSEVPARAA